MLLDNWSIELFKIGPVPNSKIGEMSLSQYAKYKPEVRVEITSWVHANGSLLCGTDTADIVSISLQDARLNEVVNHSQMLEAIRPMIEYDKALGTVEAIATNPDCPGELLVGYQRGICIRYDLEMGKIISLFKSSRTLEALDWVEADRAVLSFGDGSVLGSNRICSILFFFEIFLPTQSQCVHGTRP